MSNFWPATPVQGFLIPVPSGWAFTNKGNECLIEKSNGEAVKFKIQPADPYGPEKIARYCTRYEVFSYQGTITRRGYRRTTAKVLEWLINQK